MGSTKHETLVSDVRLSSVVPASITGEDKVQELTNMDLIMKLHYIKGIYFFSSDAARGLTIHDLKKPMFECLALYSPLSGRIRKSEPENNCKPFIKCNDSGVRVVEAKCSKTLDEWLEEILNDSCLNDQLIYHQPLGPDSGFTPLVFIQFTWFKCGGISIGLSWAHILGDAFSASQFINIWGQFLNGQLPIQQIDDMPSTRKKNNPLPQVAKVPFSIQRVQLDSVCDKWLVSNNCNMGYHSFHLTAKQINHLIQAAKSMKPFEAISAIMWKSLAKVRGKSSEPKIVTICSTNNSGSWDKENGLPSNSQVKICTIQAANLSVEDADLEELANLIAHKKKDETNLVEEIIDQKENDGKIDDFVLYGAKLTFVNLENAKIYGLELRGQRPIFASYSLSGVGDEGAILVLPGPASDGKEEGGRVVNLVLPEKQLEKLKYELKKEWGIF
ncbi:hypothetical protein ACH5RR_034717 [Cinchona calisaya]|uniref:Uncharacterized protein n=1 Tax=Cinchona calisaya TaxID=153742 RepID=A0ABD2YBR5_9GENT